MKAIHGKANMSSVQEGSSSAPGNAQRLQALRHRHAPWLLFGLCICLSAAVGSFAPRLLIGSPPAFAEAVAKKARLSTASNSSSPSSKSEESQGKKVHFDYHVTGEVMTRIQMQLFVVPILAFRFDFFGTYSFKTS